MPSRRIVFLQPYIAQYRFAFFESLKRNLAEKGDSLILLAGRPRIAQAKRGDKVSSFGEISVTRRWFGIGRFGIASYSIGSHLKNADVLVCEYSITSLTTWRLAFTRNRGYKLVLWGHGLNFGRRTSKLKRMGLRLLGSRADVIAAYTSSGAEDLRRLGLKTPIFGVNNTFDWESDYPDRSAYAGKNAHVHGRPLSLGYLGGIDRAKGASSLSLVLDSFWQLDKSVRFEIVGSGAGLEKLRSAQAREQVVLHGFVKGTEKQKILSGIDALIMPGPVGLLAIDALALGVPIFTLSRSFHGPEVSYLKENESIFLHSESIDTFAEFVLRTMSSRTVHSKCVTPPKLEEFVDNFIAVLQP